MADENVPEDGAARKKKPETPEERAARLAYMKAYYAASKQRQLAQQKANRAANPAKYAESDRRKYLRNLEHNRRVRREYRVANLEKINAQRRARYQRDKPVMLAAQKVYKKRNRDRLLASLREWQRANPDLVRAYKATSKAKRRGAAGSFPKTLVADIRKAQRDRCAYCRDQLRGRGHVDHIRAIANGGTNDGRNIQLTCRPCNLRKWKKDALDFAREMGLLI